MKLMCACVIAFAGVASAQPEAVLLSNPNASAGNYLSVPDAPDLRPTQFSLECWFRPDGPGIGNTGDIYGACLIGRPGQNTSGGYLESWAIYWSPVTNHVIMRVTHSFGGAGDTLISSAVCPIGQWHHVAGTFDGAAMRIYIDGVFDSSLPVTSSVIDYSRPDPILIGSANYAFGYLRRFQGAMDEVRIWDHARSAQEIAQNWNVTPCGPLSGLLAGWSFTSGSLADISSNGHAAQPAVSVSFTTQTDLLLPSADFNEDGFIDFFDFNDFISCFEDSICPPNRTADFNDDGFADFFDFNDFVTAFEAGC